jgi:tRNA(Ile)-lysidine synthase TilS/MesJ
MSPVRLDSIESVDAKVDLFFRLYITPHFQPEKIHWWLSLSGGKDSFAMAQALRNWYGRASLPFYASSFSIDQWGGDAVRKLGPQIAGDQLIILDGRRLTAEKTGYKPGEQAPCRACSDVRHELTDTLLLSTTHAASRINVVARGLHLSDTAVSLLWRFLRGREPAAELTRLGKARPFTRLPNGAFLAKPFSYVREFESAAYADKHGFSSACCGCPACKFPSRRDIVEETACGFFDDPLWEFDIPGMSELLTHFGATAVRALSAPGQLAKHRHLPDNFASFVVERFRRQAFESKRKWAEICDPARDLDVIGTSRLGSSKPLEGGTRIPLPGLFQPRPLSHLEEAMIATMGPFWGAIGLTPMLAAQAWRLQKTSFDFLSDDLWTQVNVQLHAYYKHGALLPNERLLMPLRRTSSTPKGTR